MVISNLYGSGYMPPEYAMAGKFSEKTDVFSFGVLMLEIISGIRNSEFWHPEESLTLLGYVHPPKPDFQFSANEM